MPGSEGAQARPEAVPPPTRGLSATEAVLAVLLLAVLCLVVLHFARQALLPGDLTRLGVLGSVKALYGVQRLQDLSLRIQAFQVHYGALPGDYAGALLPQPRGNGNGRVERYNGESARFFQDLAAFERADAGGEDSYLFLGRPLSFFWVENLHNRPQAAHFLVVERIEPAVALALDRRLDDGNPEQGCIQVLYPDDSRRTRLFFRWDG